MIFDKKTILVIGADIISSYIDWTDRSTCVLFGDGAGAVDLFFVLSGFVLALPYVCKVENPKYLQYCFRRAFRLYPALWFALVLCVVLRLEYDPAGMDLLSDWSRTMWTSDVTPGIFLRNLPLLFGHDSQQLDPVIWTLILELRLSIVLPVIIVALNFSRRLSFDLAILALSLVFANMIDALALLPLFALGAVAAKHHATWSLKIAEMKKFWWLVVFCAGILLYGNRWIIPGLSNFQQEMGSGFGSLIIILCTLSSAALTGALSKPLPHFMGQTSYSFYLLHLPLMLFVTSRLFPLTNSNFLCSVVTLIIAYLLAYWVFRFIEQPMNELGRNISINFTNWLQRSRAIKDQA